MGKKTIICDHMFEQQDFEESEVLIENKVNFLASIGASPSPYNGRMLMVELNF